MELIDFLAGFFGGGVGAALIGFLARDWVAVRLKAAIEKEAFIQRAVFDLKRSACLDALAVVDAAFSQRDWQHIGQEVEVAKQVLEIEAARRAYNQLALTCSDPSIVDLYVRALGLRLPDQPPETVSADLIVDLRNTMRKELGFGSDLNFDRERAWIAKIDGVA